MAATVHTEKQLEFTGELTERLRGEVIGVHDSVYDEARKLVNTTIDKLPAAIARCVDVIAAVAVAREGGLEVAIRCGAHNQSIRRANW
jgi:hypothetical protein